MSGTRFDYRQRALRSSDDPRGLVVEEPEPAPARAPERGERGVEQRGTWTTKILEDLPECCVRFSDEHLRSIGWGVLDAGKMNKTTEHDDSDSSSEDSCDEVQMHNTSDGPVMIKRKYEWTGAPGLSEIVKKTTGCQMMSEIENFVRTSAVQGAT